MAKAWIRTKKRSDGVTSYYVSWREGGGSDVAVVTETFSQGSTRENRNAAEGFKDEVDAAGCHWPEGWSKGYGYGKPEPEPEPVTVPQFDVAGLEQVAQNLDISPGMRKRYNSYVRGFKSVCVIRDGVEYHPFDQPIDRITRADVVLWRAQSIHALKTQKNYHGLLSSIFTYAMAQGWVTQNPCTRTAPSNRKIKEQQGEKRFLTESEFAIVCEVARGVTDDAEAIVKTFAGTGFRAGELTALWVRDVDLDKREITVNKAWKENGEHGKQDVPPWLRKRLQAKHVMRGHWLGAPKSEAGKRTIRITRDLVEVLRPLVEGRAGDDMLFVSPSGLPLHLAELEERIWVPMMKGCRERGVAPFGRHDLRHSHVAWLMAAGVAILAISKRLGHADIAITQREYGHLLPQHDDHIDEALDAVFAGTKIRNPKRLTIVRAESESRTG